MPRWAVGRALHRPVHSKKPDPPPPPRGLPKRRWQRRVLPAQVLVVWRGGRSMVTLIGRPFRKASTNHLAQFAAAGKPWNPNPANWQAVKRDDSISVPRSGVSEIEVDKLHQLVHSEVVVYRFGTSWISTTVPTQLSARQCMLFSRLGLDA